jgi:hypothetical protein
VFKATEVSQMAGPVVIQTEHFKTLFDQHISFYLTSNHALDYKNFFLPCKEEGGALLKPLLL